MKFIFTLLTLLICSFSNAQDGVLSGDTLKLNSGQYFIKGQSLTIGKGSKQDGVFAYISTRPDKIGRNVIAPVYLVASWSGYKMKIAGFESIGNDITGKSYYLLLTIDDRRKAAYMASAELAVSSGEILK